MKKKETNKLRHSEILLATEQKQCMKMRGEIHSTEIAAFFTCKTQERKHWKMQMEIIGRCDISMGHFKA